MKDTHYLLLLQISQLAIYIYICDLRNTAYLIVRNKTLNETAKGNLKNTLIQSMFAVSVSVLCIYI